MKQFAAVACILLLSFAALANDKQPNPFRHAPPEVEEALRARVTQFYSFFKAGKFRQAEELVTEESKDLFYNSQKKPLLGFQVGAITFGEDFKEANVLVNVDALVPFMGARPLKIPVAGKWRWVNDDWFLHMETRSVEGPFGKMKRQEVSTGDTSGAFGGGLGQGITPEAFRSMYQLNRTEVKFPAASDKPVKRSVTFVNPGPARLTLERQGSEIAGLLVEPGEGPLEPGERRDIFFTYQPETARLKGQKKINFDVLPLMRRFSIKATFVE